MDTKSAEVVRSQGSRQEEAPSVLPIKARTTGPLGPKRTLPKAPLLVKHLRVG